MFYIVLVLPSCVKVVTGSCTLYPADNQVSHGMVIDQAKYVYTVTDNVAKSYNLGIKLPSDLFALNLKINCNTSLLHVIVNKKLYI